MQRLVQILVLIVVVAAGGYGALKGYVWFKVKGKLDDAVLMAGPYADISYGGISSELRGSVAVDDLRIAPHGAAGELHAASVQLQGPNLGFLLDLAGGKFDAKRIPERVTLRVSDLRVPAGGNLVAGFTPPDTTLPASTPDPCNLAGIFRPDAAKLANPTLDIDATLGYQVSPTADQTRLFVDYHIQGVEAMNLAVALRGQLNPAAMMSGSTPSLGAFDLSYTLDPAHAGRAIRYCAGKAKQPTDAFIDDLLSRSDGYYERVLGFVPGPGIRAALGRYMRQPGEIQVTAHPPASLDPSTLALYKPEDIVSLLGLNVTVNGQPLQDLSFAMPQVATHASTVPDWIAEMYRQTPTDGEAQESSPDAEHHARPTPAEPKRVKRFLAVEIGELKHYVGSDVRLYTTQGGKPRQGVLVSLQNGEASVEQRVSGGNITSHTPLADIEKAEVFKSEES